MKIQNIKRFAVCAALVLTGLLSRAGADTGLYSFPKVEEQKIIVPEKKKLDPFMALVAKKMNVAEDVMAEEFKRGAGRGEMIRLILISQKSGESLNAIIREREKGTWFYKLAEKHKLDNKALRKESQKIQKEIEKELKAQESAQRAETQVRPSTTTAGVGGADAAASPGQTGQPKY